MQSQLMDLAARLTASHGPDAEEALRLWEAAGGFNADAERDASTWLSVAFLFARFTRSQRH